MSTRPLERLRGPGPIHGFWSVTAHPAIIETASTLEPDFICLDAQHGTHLSRLTTETFTTMAHYGVPGLVRVGQNDPVDIGRALDLGAAGIMAPMVENVDDARSAVSACRYAPVGSRSFGVQTPRVEPLSESQDAICAVQIETAAAVENVDEIAGSDGVDWLYIGPADLGLALGGVPAPDVDSIFDGSHPLATEMMSAFDAVVTAATKHGKLAGLHTGSGSTTLAAQKHGFRVAAVATDIVEIRSGLSTQLRTVRGDP